MIAAPNNTYAGIRSVQYGAAGHKYVDFNPYEAIEEAFDLSGKRSHLSRQFILKFFIILPRQARDKQIESTQKERNAGVVLQPIHLRWPTSLLPVVVGRA